jgi:EAL domain-containing protein (putative c-di-GMP-specific phosphodiesterase class I)
MDENGYKKFLLKNDLKKAINEEQFFVVYQPRVNPSTHEINGVEALIRWNHPNFGPVSPQEFIPYAEETGLIIPLGNWILTKVCRQVKDWQNQGIKPIKASVNISAIQLLQPKFVSTLQSTIRKTKLAPEWLELEITETVLVNKEDQAIKTLKKLRSMGITVALDDFGTGYSALNYLTKYKFDVIKIDRSILKNIPTDVESYEIAHAIVKLAQRLNKSVVAEGIETPSQLALIEKMGCNEFQGYICSQPVNEAMMKQLLLEGKWKAPLDSYCTLFEKDECAAK